MSEAQTYRPYTYDHIPQLPELMPSTAGRPGVEYLQCCVHHLREAQDVEEKDGGPWGHILGGSKVYTITGPKGSADMHLLCRGDPIPGGDPKSGVRNCVVDAAVEELTGHFIEGPPKDEKSSKTKAYEDAETIEGLGTLVPQPEGKPVAFDDAAKGTPITESRESK